LQEANHVAVKALAVPVNKHFKTVNKKVLRTVPLVSRVMAINGIAKYNAEDTAKALYESVKLLNETVIEKRTREGTIIKKVINGRFVAAVGTGMRKKMSSPWRVLPVINRAVGAKKSRRIGAYGRRK
jgi:hypothetical protein